MKDYFTSGGGVENGKIAATIIIVSYALEIAAWNLLSFPCYPFGFIFFLFAQTLLVLYCFVNDRYIGLPFRSLFFLLSVICALLILWGYHIPDISIPVDADNHFFENDYPEPARNIRQLSENGIQSAKIVGAKVWHTFTMCGLLLASLVGSAGFKWFCDWNDWK